MVMKAEKLYFPIGGVNRDSHRFLKGAVDLADSKNFRISSEGAVTREGYGQLGSTLPSAVLHFCSYVPPDSAASTIFAFTKNKIYEYQTDWVEVGSIDTEVNFWHTTRFLDTEEGVTIVAAGSNPPLPYGEETDKDDRVLLYYDRTLEAFTDLELYDYLDLIKFDTDEVCADTRTETELSSTLITSTKSLFATNDYEIDRAVFWTIENGIIADTALEATVQDGESVYLLEPINSAEIAEATSYILVSGYSETGDVWNLDLLQDKYEGPIYIDVKYKTSVTTDHKPRFVWSFHNRLLFANEVIEDVYYPWRLHWSAVGDMFYVDSRDYRDLIELDNTSIRGGEYLDKYLVIYKDKSIVYASTRENGSLSFVTRQEIQFAGMKTLATVNYRQFFLGKHDVYIWDGNYARSLTERSVEGQPSSSRIKNYLFSLVDKDNILNCSASVNTEETEYWLWVPLSTKTVVFVYSILQDIWYLFELPVAYNAGEFTREDSTGETTLVTYFSDSSGIVYEFDSDLTTDAGAEIESTFVTRDFLLSTVPEKDRWQRVEIGATGTSLDISVTDQDTITEADFEQETTIDLTETHPPVYYPDFVGKHTRFFIKLAKAGSVQWLLPYAQVKEEK